MNLGYIYEKLSNQIYICDQLSKIDMKRKHFEEIY